MSTFTVIIPFTPKAKASVRGKKGIFYNPSAKGMNRVQKFVSQQMEIQNVQMLKGPLLVIVHHQIPAPLSHPERKRRQLHGFPHTKRPDGDNMEKFLNDALNGVLWPDDCKLAWVLRSKSMTNAKEGQTVLFVRELENTTPDYALILADIKEHICLQ
jgi:Holliday junction resolvase RusA-like endonuclease